MMFKLDGCVFSLKMMNYWKNITFRINLALILKKNLAANLSTIKKLLKSKIKSFDDAARDFYNQEIPNAGSNQTCLAVSTIGSAFKKDENYHPHVFLQECK